MYEKRQGQVVDAIIPSYLYKKDDPLYIDLLVKYMYRPSNKTYKEIEQMLNTDELKVLVANQYLLTGNNNKIRALANLLYSVIISTDPVTVNNVLGIKTYAENSYVNAIDIVEKILLTYKDEPYSNRYKYYISTQNNYKILVINNRTYLDMMKNSYVGLDPETNAKMKTVINTVIDELCYSIYRKDANSIDDIIPSELYTLVKSSLLNTENP